MFSKSLPEQQKMTAHLLAVFLKRWRNKIVQVDLCDRCNEAPSRREEITIGWFGNRSQYKSPYLFYFNDKYFHIKIEFFTVHSLKTFFLLLNQRKLAINQKEIRIQNYTSCLFFFRPQNSKSWTQQAFVPRLLTHTVTITGLFCCL